MDKAKVLSTACANIGFMKNIDVTVEKCRRNVTDSKILMITYAITRRTSTSAGRVVRRHPMNGSTVTRKLVHKLVEE